MANKSANVQSSPRHPSHSSPSRCRLWTRRAIVAAAVCLFLMFAFVSYHYRAELPMVSNFFSTPTSTHYSLNNGSAGISFSYPTDWKYAQSGNPADGFAIVVASSQDILDNVNNVPKTGAAMLVHTQSMAAGDFPFSVDASAMTKVLDSIAAQFSNFSQGQNVHAFTLSGFPAASGVFTASNTSLPPSTVYLVTVLRNKEIILIFSICPQSEWSQYQPVLDDILNSMIIVKVP